MYASVVFAVIVCLFVRPSVCLSVCPSVTSRCFTKMAKAMITQTTLYDSPGTKVFCCQRFRQIFKKSPPTGATNKGG